MSVRTRVALAAMVYLGLFAVMGTGSLPLVAASAAAGGLALLFNYLGWADKGGFA